MTIPVPKLDDRRFDAMVADTLKLIRSRCPEWTEMSPGDPGVTLVELFAFLTENMIYRLNRVPEKLYASLLNLVGAQVRAPAAAEAVLTFTREGADGGDIALPSGIEVATGDGSVVFTTIEAVTLPAGQSSIEVRALNAELVAGELGVVTLGQSLRVARAPIIAPTGDGHDVVVAVERRPDDPADLPTRAFGGRSFVIWNAAAGPVEAVETERAFLVDRAAGLVTFPIRPEAPGTAAASASVGDREVRIWYRRGGGRAGNVRAGTLTVMRTPGLGVSVVNRAAAAGGADIETLESAVRRNPVEVMLRRGAITARDFERVAVSVGGVAHAHAEALAQLWRHADPGTVQLLLTPAIDAAALPEGAITADAVAASRSEALRARVAQVLDDKRPLGVRVVVGWVQVRPVAVRARVVVTRGEDAGVKAQSIRSRLNALFSPLNDHLFGRAVRASDAYEVILSEPGVRYADSLRFIIGETPEHDVTGLARDPHQPRTWFAATEAALHRSLDDGDSWSVVYRKEDERPRFVRPHPARAGLLALGVIRQGGGAIRFSTDCGESWAEAAVAFNCDVADAAWIERDGKPLLLIATQQGVFQFQPGSGGGPAPVAVDAALDPNGYYAIAASTAPSGAITVAVAARRTAGILLSAQGDVSGTFQPIGLKDKDVRILTVQHFNARDYLWAGPEAEAGQQGDGAYRLQLGADGRGAGEWQTMNVGWTGGACQALAFVGSTAFAASDRSGVVTLDTNAAKQAWTAMPADAGLPRGAAGRAAASVVALATGPADAAPLVFAGLAEGVFRSTDAAAHFAPAAATEIADRIPLPPNWLYCAAPHDITVVQETDA